VCIDLVFILICNKIDTSYKIILVFLSVSQVVPLIGNTLLNYDGLLVLLATCHFTESIPISFDL
jgi:hypothetical protein